MRRQVHAAFLKHPSWLLVSVDDTWAPTNMLACKCFNLHCSMLVQGLVTCRHFLWLTALHVILLPSSVSAAPWLLLRLPLLDIDILKTVVVLWCLCALTHFDSNPFSTPHVPLLCRCVWMHGFACITHEGVTLADLTEKKKGRFGWFSQSSDTHGKSCGFPPVFSGYYVWVCVSVYMWVLFVCFLIYIYICVWMNICVFDWYSNWSNRETKTLKITRLKTHECYFCKVRMLFAVFADDYYTAFLLSILS